MLWQFTWLCMSSTCSLWCLDESSISITSRERLRHNRRLLMSSQKEVCSLCLFFWLSRSSTCSNVTVLLTLWRFLTVHQRLFICGLSSVIIIVVVIIIIFHHHRHHLVMLLPALEMFFSGICPWSYTKFLLARDLMNLLWEFHLCLQRLCGQGRRWTD